MLEQIDPKDLDMDTEVIKISMLQTEENGDILHCITTKENKIIKGSVFLVFSKNGELIIHPMTEDFLNVMKLSGNSHDNYISVVAPSNVGDNVTVNRIKQYHKRKQYVNSLSIGDHYDELNNNYQIELSTVCNSMLNRSNDIILSIKEIRPLNFLVGWYLNNMFKPLYVINYRTKTDIDEVFLELQVYRSSNTLIRNKISDDNYLKVRKNSKVVELV